MLVKEVFPGSGHGIEQMCLDGGYLIKVPDCRGPGIWRIQFDLGMVLFLNFPVWVQQEASSFELVFVLLGVIQDVWSLPDMGKFWRY